MIALWRPISRLPSRTFSNLPLYGHGSNFLEDVKIWSLIRSLRTIHGCWLQILRRPVCLSCQCFHELLRKFSIDDATPLVDVVYQTIHANPVLPIHVQLFDHSDRLCFTCLIDSTTLIGISSMWAGARLADRETILFQTLRRRNR